MGEANGNGEGLKAAYQVCFYYFSLSLSLSTKLVTMMQCSGSNAPIQMDGAFVRFLSVWVGRPLGVRQV
jgi:hypothetical protein